VSEGGIQSGVGKTALRVAMVRAGESRRPDRLFDDPYAEGFLAAAPGLFDVEQPAAPAGAGELASWGAEFSAHAVIRTRFFDDYLLDATRDGVHQVVLLAAGLDTRAYRLRWPDGVRLYELDLAGVLEFKERVLDERAAVPSCQRTSVPVDLRADWTVDLREVGFAAAEPTAWLAEGLLIYLSADEAEKLLSRVSELCPAGSRLSLEVGNLGSDAIRDRADQAPTMQQYAKLWKGGLPDAQGWLGRHGWRTQLDDRASVSATYGRAPAGSSSGGFITATRPG